MQSGDVIGERFEVLSAARSGGMGTVYRARDRHTGEFAAVKVLQPAAQTEIDRFAREAQVLATLRHPGIVRYIAHGRTVANEPYLAMEWLDGEDLADRLARRGLTPAESLTVARAAAETLGATHRRGVIHRDIKPSNLFLVGGSVTNVRLLDFGIARITDANRAATRTGMVVGTPGYMAPEQARGERSTGPSTDVFALGCVLFECLTGHPAFAGDHVMAVLARILLEEPAHVRTFQPELPEALDALVARALSKDPTLRPADGDAMAAELAKIPDVATVGEARVSHRPPALTLSELRLLSVVLAAGNAPRIPTNEAMATVEMVHDAELGSLREDVARHGGRIEHLADGAILVTLADTGVATDQAARAARCALAIRRRLAKVHIAIATGRAAVEGRMPVGEVVDRAAAIVAATRTAGGETPDIRVDEVTAGLLDARFDVRGDASGLVLRDEHVISDATRLLLGRPTPCVGRDQELATLDAVLAETIDESMARVVLVTAAAGLGKSRLRHEFVRRARQARPNVEIWLARGDPMSAGSPFGMIATMIRSAASVQDGEPLEVRQQKLRARVARHVAPDDVARVTEFLAELSGAAFAADASVQLGAGRRDAIVMGDQMRRAWEDLVAAECAAHPMVLVFEDMQWGDLPSAKFVDSALRNLSERSLMVVAIARPEIHELFPKLWAEREVMEVRLRGLSRKASEKLVTHVLGDSVDRALVARLVERAGGNALYLEELIRAAHDGNGDEPPATVLAMMQSRLERLDPQARRVLRAASVFGQVFWMGAVEVLLGGMSRGGDTASWLSLLVEQEVIEPRANGRFPDEREYSVRHALARDAAYATLTDHDRALGHRLAGAWLEEHGERDAVALGEHFERGGEKARAAEFYARAAEQTLEGNDFATAIAIVQRAVACGASGELLGALRRTEAEARRWRGEFAESTAAATEAMALLPRESDGWYRAAAELASAYGVLTRTDDLVALTSALHDRAIENVSASRVIATAHLVVQLNHLGRYAMAQELVDWMSHAARDAAAREPLVSAWIERARMMRAASSLDAAGMLACSASSVRDFTTAGDLRMACFQHMNFGYAKMMLGRPAEAIEPLEHAEQTARRLGLVHVAASVRSYLGFASWLLGRLDEAEARLREAIAALGGLGERRMRARAYLYLSRTLMQRGDLAGAEQCAADGVETAGALPTLRGLARVYWAHVVLARGRVADAFAAITEAHETRVKHGSVEDGEPLLLLTYAEVLHAVGSEVRARGVIGEARTALMARAAKITDDDVRRSFLEGVGDNARTLQLAAEWGA